MPGFVVKADGDCQLTEQLQMTERYSMSQFQDTSEMDDHVPEVGGRVGRDHVSEVGGRVGREGTFSGRDAIIGQKGSID